VALAAHEGWINLSHTPLQFLGSTAAVVVFTLLAVGELIADQLPFTPSRTKPPGLIARVVLGALSGTALAVAGAQSMAMGAALGAAGGVAGAFGGYQVRTRLVTALKVPDFVIATLEDAGGDWRRNLPCDAILKPRAIFALCKEVVLRWSVSFERAAGGRGLCGLCLGGTVALGIDSCKHAATRFCAFALHFP